jgi:hypothetical protein
MGDDRMPMERRSTTEQAVDGQCRPHIGCTAALPVINDHGLAAL